MPSPPAATDDLARRVAAGERRALAKAITLVESSNPAHRDNARALLAALPEPVTASLRIGLSGTPGVGKSTFIEALGMRLADAGHRIAVLAVDPSSVRSGGSILGDKTRMASLSRHANAYIRPTPSHGELGGIARRTRETVRLVEAAGFDIVLVETVGVGQSETMVAEITDLFLLLLAPAGGDELQGVKRGIMEIADLIVVNKADGALKPVAEATRSDYQGALSLLRRRPFDPEGIPAALCVSAQTGDGIDTLWERATALANWRTVEGWRDRRRAEQARKALHRAFDHAVLTALHARAAPALAETEAAIEKGLADPDTAAAAIVARLLGPA